MTMEIRNIDLKNAVKDAISSGSLEGLPSQILDKVAPVIDVNPNHCRTISIVKGGTCGNTTTTTIYTTPTNQDFYICGFSIATIRDATATSTSAQLTCYINGVNTPLIRLPAITLTVNSTFGMSVNLPFPIKVDRNTIIAITNTTGTANVYTSAQIYGYLVDPF